MSVENEDLQNGSQDSAPSPAGTPDANALSSQIAELNKRLQDQDRKITELANEKSAIEKRLEDVTRPGQPSPQGNVGNEFDQALVDALNDSAVGNTEAAAQKLRNVFSNAITASQQQAISQVMSQIDAKARLERHVSGVKAQKTFVNRYEKEIARDTYARIEEARRMGRTLSPEQAFDESVHEFERKRDEDIQQFKSASPAPNGSQGERSSGSSPRLDTQPKEEVYSDSDYISMRKSRLEGRTYGRAK